MFLRTEVQTPHAGLTTKARAPSTTIIIKLMNQSTTQQLYQSFNTSIKHFKDDSLNHYLRISFDGR